MNTRGVLLTTPTGVSAAGLSTDVNISAEDGMLIGISAAGPYAADVLAGALLTVSNGSYRPFTNVPVTQLQPQAGHTYTPLAKSITPGSTVQVLLKALVALDANKPVLIVLHFTNSR